MTRGVRKADLPTKTCKACGRPFAWRKKWEKTWVEVRYCSERCRRQGSATVPVPVASPAAKPSCRQRGT